MSLGNQTRSGIGGFGEVPNRGQRNQGSKKADIRTYSEWVSVWSSM